MIDYDFYIPIDHVISDFAAHLKSHERSILSAKFGEGKTFFLHEFINNETINNDFVFLVLHPVNYQVVENKDIFELIKRDLLFQIVKNQIYDPEYKITDAVALSFYLQNNFQSLAYSLLPYLSYLNCDTKTTSALAAGLASIKFLKGLKDKVNKFKEENSETNVIDSFIANGESFIYENDAITRIIRDNICAYKRKQGKRVVLVIEDMDRLDPAHLFRIMNVFSAQMDYQYLDEYDPNCDIDGNKFGLDNVLLVMDYANSERIFSHFYGIKTDFNGYIKKFCNKGIFEYSLKEQQEKYIYEKIQKVTDLPIELLKEFITSKVLSDKTIRLTCSSFDNVDNQIKKAEVVEYKSKEYELHLGILRIFVIMRRLGIPDDEIIDKTQSLILDTKELILPYIAPYLLNCSGLSVMGELKYLIGSSMFNFSIQIINDNGTVELVKKKYLFRNDNETCWDFKKLVSMILQNISK